MEVFEVTFRFVEKHKSPVTVQAVRGESILDLALDNDIELHHNCGGVCACTTCQVYIDEGMDKLPEMGEREEDYIDRAIMPRLESRLACQCMVGGRVALTVPDQSLFLGH
jgi:ferredoxin, 2Fe-2S